MEFPVCVIFRNLPPSEELVLFARELGEMLATASGWGRCGPTIRIERHDDGDDYSAEIVTPSLIPKRVKARDTDPFLALRGAFAQLVKGSIAA